MGAQPSRIHNRSECYKVRQDRGYLVRGSGMFNKMSNAREHVFALRMLIGFSFSIAETWNTPHTRVCLAIRVDGGR